MENTLTFCRAPVPVPVNIINEEPSILPSTSAGCLETISHVIQVSYQDREPGVKSDSDTNKMDIEQDCSLDLEDSSSSPMPTEHATEDICVVQSVEDSKISGYRSEG